MKDQLKVRRSGHNGPHSPDQLDCRQNPSTTITVDLSGMPRRHRLTAKRLTPARRERILLLTSQRLRLSDGQSSFGLVPPETLHICEHCDYLLMAESVAKRRHGALEARISGIFKNHPTLADDSVQKAIRMVPSVPVPIERRRRQGAVFLPDMPVGLPLAADSMTHSAIQRKDLLTCWSIPYGGPAAGCRNVSAGGRRTRRHQYRG